MTNFSDDYFMKLAVQEAKKAVDNGEVPVGAVLVSEDTILSRSHNQTEQLNDVTAHAEILAITAGENFLGSKYLNNCTLYVTLEPCVMCAGALRWAQLDKLVYGAEDNKNGFTNVGRELLHPRTQVLFGLREEECSQLIKSFFAARR